MVNQTILPQTLICH